MTAPIVVFGRAERAPKRHLAATHRLRSPATTIARARRLMRPLQITRLANLTGLDTLGIPVWSAIRPNGRSLSTSQGKGFTHDAARASALMESVETWHAERLPRPARAASLRQLRARGVAAVDPRRLAHTPGARRTTLDTPLAWVEGWGLLSAAPVRVPFDAVTLDTVFPGGQAPALDVSSNGLASGNHVLEAIVHGLCEVIERDAEAHWRAVRGDDRVDLETVRSPDTRAALATLAAAGVHVTVWDLGGELGVPAYGCAILEDPREPAWRALGLYQGFGCHLDPEIAVGRALCEAVQTRVTYIAGSRDDFFPFDYDRATDEELLRGIWDDLHRPAARVVDLRTTPRLAGPSFEADLRLLLHRCAEAGAPEVAVVDLGSPLSRAAGLAIVKVIVPGRATRVDLMG